MSSVSATIRNENAWPTQVLNLSTESRNLCIGGASLYRARASLSRGRVHWRLTAKKNTTRGCRMVSLGRRRASGLLRCGGGLAEVVVVRHARAHLSVEVPTDRALGEHLLRRLDLLEQRVVGALLPRLVEHLELPLQHGVGRLVEAHLVLGLELDVVLRVTVDRLPGHVGRSGLYRVFDDRLDLRRQRVVFGLVERDLELLGVLVVALEHAHLGDVGEAEDTVGGGVVELRSVQEAPIHRWDDLA